MLRQALYDYAEVRHQFFNFLADQALSEEFNRLTNQLVALAKGQHNPGTPESATGGQKGGGKSVLGTRVHCVAPRTVVQGNRTSLVSSEIMRCSFITCDRRLTQDGRYRFSGALTRASNIVKRY